MYLIQRYTTLLIFNLQKKNTMESSVDLWEAALCYPLGSAHQVLQGKRAALFASLCGAVPESSHGGRIKFSAKR